VRWEEVIRSHVAGASAHHSLRVVGTARPSIRALGASLELEEVVDLLAVLLVLRLVALLVELRVAHLAVARDGSI